MFTYLKNFFALDHLFAMRPPVLSQRALWLLVVLFGACIVVAIIVQVMKRASRDGIAKRGWSRVVHFGWTMGVLGFVYLACAYERATLLGSRFWLPIWFVAAVLWLGSIAYYFGLTIPRRREEIIRDRNKKKYLP